MVNYKTVWRGNMLIGREREAAVLYRSLESDESQLIAVYGRRRVGKTYLIRESLKGQFTFQHSGVYRGTFSEQLQAFYDSLIDAGLSDDEGKKPSNWFDAFRLLKNLVQNSTQKKKIVFLDELSWMDTPKTDLMKALEHFWNAWASARKDVVLIVCSSATSWMLNKVIHNKGGLYNRLSAQIRLQPFNLWQCRNFVNAKKLAFSDTQIMDLYMIMGGIPFYWGLLEKGLSVAQNVDHLFFEENAPLQQEYEYLFSSIFRQPRDYVLIIQALAVKKKGLTRNEILKETGLIGSGVFTQRLKELESCGFIREYHAYGKKEKDSLYQLMDPFILFYHHFIRKKKDDPNYWSHQINTPAVNSWAGLAFEQLCLLHVEQIRKKLGITGILTDISSFTCKADPQKEVSGSQIDLLIQRADRTVNLIEMKYARGPYVITKSAYENLKKKERDFVAVTRTRDAIHLTMATPFGLVWNDYAGEIQSQIVAEDLFQD